MTTLKLRRGLDSNPPKQAPVGVHGYDGIMVAEMPTRFSDGTHHKFGMSNFQDVRAVLSLRPGLRARRTPRWVQEEEIFRACEESRAEAAATPSSQEQTYIDETPVELRPRNEAETIAAVQETRH